jgi:hypothetical protein
MTGWVQAMAPCFGCRKVFTFHPHKVPSITHDGVRQPICEDCVRRVNPQREANGLEPIVPLPGAYEGMPEEEL